MSNIEYTTLPGDRWDLIAHKAYGTIGLLTLDDGTRVNAMSLIINNNTDIGITDTLDSGLLLQIPVVANTSSQLPNQNLPPWKQV